MQNVNLYIGDLRPHREWVSSFFLVGLVSLLIFLLAIITAYSEYGLKKLEKNVIFIENQHVIAKNRITDIREKSTTGDGRTLDMRIEELRNKIRSKMSINDVLGSKRLGNDSGFSGRMMAMSKNPRKDGHNIVIERFRFSNGGRLIELSGVAKNADHITEWLSKVQNEPSYKNAYFGSLTIKKERKNTGLYHFSFGFKPLIDLAM